MEEKAWEVLYRQAQDSNEKLIRLNRDLLAKRSAGRNVSKVPDDNMAARVRVAMQCIQMYDDIVNRRQLCVDNGSTEHIHKVNEWLEEAKAVIYGGKDGEQAVTAVAHDDNALRLKVEALQALRRKVEEYAEANCQPAKTGGHHQVSDGGCHPPREMVSWQREGIVRRFVVRNCIDCHMHEGMTLKVVKVEGEYATLEAIDCQQNAEGQIGSNLTQIWNALQTGSFFGNGIVGAIKWLFAQITWLMTLTKLLQLLNMNVTYMAAVMVLLASILEVLARLFTFIDQPTADRLRELSRSMLPAAALAVAVAVANRLWSAQSGKSDVVKEAQDKAAAAEGAKAAAEEAKRVADAATADAKAVADAAEARAAAAGEAEVAALAIADAAETRASGAEDAKVAAEARAVAAETRAAAAETRASAAEAAAADARLAGAVDVAAAQAAVETARAEASTARAEAATARAEAATALAVAESARFQTAEAAAEAMAARGEAENALAQTADAKAALIGAEAETWAQTVAAEAARVEAITALDELRAARTEAQETAESAAVAEQTSGAIGLGVSGVTQEQKFELITQASKVEQSAGHWQNAAQTLRNAAVWFGEIGTNTVQLFNGKLALSPDGKVLLPQQQPGQQLKNAPQIQPGYKQQSVLTQDMLQGWGAAAQGRIGI